MKHGPCRPRSGRPRKEERREEKIEKSKHCTSTCTPTHPHIHTPTHPHTCTSTHPHTHTYTHKHTHIHLHVHTHTYAPIHTYLDTYTQHTRACTHTHTQHTHTHTHTCTLTATHTIALQCSQFIEETGLRQHGIDEEQRWSEYCLAGCSSLAHPGKRMSPFQCCCGRVAGRDPCWSPGAWTGHKLAVREPEAQDLLGRNGSAMQGMPASACTLRLPDTVRGAPVGHVRMSTAGVRTLHGHHGFAEPVFDDSAWLPEMSKMHMIHIEDRALLWIRRPPGYRDHVEGPMIGRLRQYSLYIVHHHIIKFQQQYRLHVKSFKFDCSGISLGFKLIVLFCTTQPCVYGLFM